MAVGGTAVLGIGGARRRCGRERPPCGLHSRRLPPAHAPPRAAAVARPLQHLHAGIRWARLAEPASFCLPYHLHKLSAVVSLELVLNPAMEEVVSHSAALAGLASLRRLTLRGRLPPARRRTLRRALPHLGPGVTHLAAHDLNVAGTDWSQFRQLESLDLSRSGGCRGVGRCVWAGWLRVGRVWMRASAGRGRRRPLPLLPSGPPTLLLPPPPPHTAAPADARLGPYCGGLLARLTALALAGGQLELASPAVFQDMAALQRLDLDNCAVCRPGSWLSRVLGGGQAADVVVLPPGLRELRAAACPAFDKCALELGGCAGLSRLELSSSVQLPATLKHAPRGVPLGLHVVEEAQVGLACCWGGLLPVLRGAAGRQWSVLPACRRGLRAVPGSLPLLPLPAPGLAHHVRSTFPASPASSTPAQVLTRQGRDTVTAKACLSPRLADVTHLSALGLGRSGLGLVSLMPNLRRLTLLGGERRRLELGLQLPELEALRVEGYQLSSVRGRAVASDGVVA